MLSGELGVISLFDVAQLLLLNGVTGSLHVTSEGRRGFLRFELGHIIDAVDEWLDEGEPAAFRILGWRTGTFEFQAGTPGGRRTIRHGTEGLLIEAAQRLDETAASETRLSRSRALLLRAGVLEVRPPASRDAPPVTGTTKGTKREPGSRDTR